MVLSEKEEGGVEEREERVRRNRGGVFVHKCYLTAWYQIVYDRVRVQTCFHPGKLFFKTCLAFSFYFLLIFT